ncbi:MAG: nitroreductase family protein [Coriobacteriia bacterium]|nr:nitroreductase family protein [Coriobacteriia bacterium]
MNARSSTRTFAPTPISAEERDVVLQTAMRAPTGGNMMLYTIIEIERQDLKDQLAVLCDEQPFIAKAPLVTLFVADFQKWTDLFAASDVASLEGVVHPPALGLGDLMLACSDALVAAQNAVIAAESLGIGSCYIGDIMENGEAVARLLDLPPHVFPVAMVVFGRPAKVRPATPHYTRYMVHKDSYHRLTETELAEVSADLARMHAPHGFKPGVENLPQDVYRRKFASDFMREMNRSGAWWVKRWQQPL